MQEKLLRRLAADQAKQQEELLLTHLPEALRPVLREEVTAKVVQQLKEQAEQQQEKEKQEETAQYLAARVLVVGCITTSMLIFKAELLEPNLAAAIVVPTIFKLVDSASKAAVKAPFQLPSKE
ncbi:hypothetical protein D9Q98_005023 [Chlorella vulgaris]|uniref:Uncharacterized protein n=1 Tax=Chlorella vulgaris TaxID=3077 RepID=A0A9D4TNN3_CHLVU|nr:hypothetical protein D9Q98_005023 [Chlorella vulgaris]